MKARSTTILLIVSLAINFLVAGAAIGFILREKPGPKFPNHLGRVLADVDPEQRKDLKQRFREFREEGKERHQEMRRHQRKLAKVVMREPFDEDAVRAAFTEARAARDEVQAHMQDQMIEAIKDLEPQQRAEVMKRILRPNPRRRDSSPD